MSRVGWGEEARCEREGMKELKIKQGGSLSLKHHQLEIGRLAMAVGARKEKWT